MSDKKRRKLAKALREQYEEIRITDAESIVQSTLERLATPLHDS